MADLIEECERGGFIVVPDGEVENGVDTAVERRTGVARGEAQPGVPDPLLILARALKLDNKNNSLLLFNTNDNNNTPLA